MKRINYELEKFESPDGNFFTITLTGDTFDAKEIIKASGNFTFSDPVGRIKAWRSKPFFEKNLANYKKEVHMIVNNIYASLKAAGYTVVKN